MRTICASLMAVTLLVSGSVAAPLPAGKPAGVKEAAVLGPNVFLVLLGAGVIIGGITLAVSNNGNDGVTTPTTTGTAGLP